MYLLLIWVYSYTANYSGTSSILEWNWDVQDPWTLSYAYGNNAEIQAGNYSTVVLVRARNACGWTSGSLSGNPHIHYLNVCGEYGIYSYPNPVDNQLTISLDEDVQFSVENSEVNNLTTDKKSQSNFIENIVIYDDSANEILRKFVRDKNVKIDCSALNKGTYILHINTTEGKKIRKL